MNDYEEIIRWIRNADIEGILNVTVSIDFIEQLVIFLRAKVESEVKKKETAYYLPGRAYADHCGQNSCS